MKRTNLLSLALAAALLGAMSPAAANAQDPNAGRFRGQPGDKWWDPQAQSRSQEQRGWHRGWRSGYADFQGRWVAQGRND
ncbi:MAG TPA: hypothetical protein VK123_06070, partial [Candidatus Limnocylindrales bacterium]|nr:hypothetical protein [Candidatus Limnocylindrales bacterium]